MFDIIVVGCGLSGMVIARTLAESGKKVHIVEKRSHIGGNIYDYKDLNGVLVQKYGPHVFFTDDISIEAYIKQYCDILYFYPECRTYINGKAIPMPFNFASIDIIYEKSLATKLKVSLIKEYGENSVVSVLDVINSTNGLLHEYGMFMYRNEYRKYTSKQWAKPIEDIDPSVFLRVPVYISYKTEYLNKKIQFMPVNGFTALAENIIHHPNITVETEKDGLKSLEFDDKNGFVEYYKSRVPVVYTGPLDALFHYSLGELPYRALEFTWKEIDSTLALETPLSAFPEGDKYIRITDYTQFPPQKSNNGKNVIAIEYPFEYKRNELCGNEPYYPTLTDESKKLHDKYVNIAKRYINLYTCGRLADYKYYNMDSVILRAFDVAKDILNKEFNE